MESSNPVSGRIRSLPAGAALGALCLAGSALAAIWLSGYSETFSGDRGRLQLLVAIPLASLLTAGLLTVTRVLTLRQAAWAMLPVGALLLGASLLEVGYLVWQWALVIGAALFVPWSMGALTGVRIARRRSLDL